jgi:hypothetical protein
MKTLEITSDLSYNEVVLTIVLILIIGRMIDRFVNGRDDNNSQNLK